VFRNNRNKQKTNRNRSKFGKISTFLIPHTISSVCFGCFDTGLKHWNKLKQTEKKIFWFREKANRKTTKTDWVSVCFGSNREKKDNGFEDPLIENAFWRFFRFVSVCFENILFVSVVLILVPNTKTNRKNVFWFRETNRKTTETDWVSVCFGWNRKKNLIVSRTP
jgi:hypothetical protein